MARTSWSLLAFLLVLLVIHLGLIFSLAPTLFSSQLLYCFFSLLAFFIFSRLDYRLFFRFHFVFLLLANLLLVVNFFLASRTRATLRWINLGFFNLQLSEALKPVFILAFASFAFGPWSFKKLLFSLGLMALPAFLVLQQPDLGSALLIGAIWLGIVFLKINWRQIAFLALFFLVVGLGGWSVLKDYQQQRLWSFLNPTADPLGSGYHLIQATIAAGSGRLFGRGFLRGTQSHLHFLPERHNDFIFASLCEELGFLGAFFLLLVYFLLLCQILKTAKNIDDEFGALICAGVFSLLLAQIVINTGMNLGLLPITGLTLPFISSGGSSLLALSACLGLVGSVARQGRLPKPIQIG